MRAGLRGGAARHAGRVFAEIVDYPSRHCVSSHVSLHFFSTILASDRADPEYISGSRKIRGVDDSSALCLRPEFPDGQVPASAEQDHGHGLDFRRLVGAAYTVQLVGHAEARVGNGRWSCRSGRGLVVHCGGAADICVQRDLW